MGPFEPAELPPEAFDVAEQMQAYARAALATPAAPAQAEPSALPVAWRPAIKCTPEQNFNAGQPSQQDIDYWKAQGCGIEYAYASPAAQPVAVPAVTEDMVKAYLKANTEYWREVDAQPTTIGRWRNGTTSEATRVSLMAALAASPEPEPAGALTEEQIDAMWSDEIERSKDMSLKRQWLRFARAIERAHGIAPKAVQEDTP